MKRFLEMKAELMKLSLPIGILMVTAYPDYNIIFANEKFRRMLGFADEESFRVAHRSAWNCIYAEDIARLKAEAALRNGDPEPYEIAYRVVRQDGSLMWVNQCSQHMLDENGDELVYAYYTDITAQKQTEQALRESEARYAAAVRSADINIWEYDYATDVMDIFSTSPRANPKDGIIVDYLKTVVSEGHIREDCAPLLFDMIARLKDGQREVTADLWIRNKRGDEFWCERVIYINEFDAEGRPVKAYCVGRDITREKEAEKRYNDERSCREAMQQATMASINMNLTQNTILDYKSNFAEVTAHMGTVCTAQDYFDQVCSELTTAEMQQRHAATFSRDALLRQFANGKTALSMEFSRKIEGRVYFVMVTANMMRRENGEIVAFLYSTDITGERTMQNIMSAIASTDYDFLMVGDIARDTAVRYSQEGFGETFIRESSHFIEGSRDYVRRTVCPEDVDRVLVAAVQMAERANAAKSEFLSRISHEIRTPMNAIMGMDQLAAQRLDDPAFVGECIEKSQYASRYLLQLLNDVLDMSKIETGKVTLKIAPIACQPFLDSVSTIVATQAEAKGVHYIVTQFEGCQDGYLGDGVRLQQVLVNILTNAVKFTPEGGTVQLDIAPVPADGAEVRIRFTISDTGIGISPHFLPDIFKPFAQEHSGTRSDYGGSGLGLAISKNLVQLMGGEIFVDSVLGEGTTFRVEIPFGVSEHNSGEVAAAAVPQTRDSYDFGGKRILLVEDHPLNIMVASKLLEFKNATVEVAENGKIGLDLFATAPEHTYDAVLMDIRMPVMDGLQAARAIRGLSSPWAKRVPIIAMSANAFPEDVLKSKAAGMDAHLAKPVEATLLYETLDELCKKAQ